MRPKCKHDRFYAVRKDDNKPVPAPCSGPVITLTVAEIESLAMYAGLRLVEDVGSGYDDLETAISIIPCASQGVDNLDGTHSHFKFVAYFHEYPEEGVCGLGKAIDQNATSSQSAAGDTQ